MIDIIEDVLERLSDLEHIESRQLRFFRIAEVDTEALRVRYQYENGELSGRHRWASLTTRSHHPPMVGDTCLVLMQHGDPGLSVVLGGVRDEAVMGCNGDADVVQGAYRYDRETRELRLGTSDPDAEVDAVALAGKVKDELSAIRSELEAIQQTLGSLGGQAAFGTPYVLGYEAGEVGSEQVKVG